MKRTTYWDLLGVLLLVLVIVIAARLQYLREKDLRREVSRLQKLTQRLDERFWQLKGDWHQTEQELSDVRDVLEDMRTTTQATKP